MANMTVRNIPDEVHNALKARALNNGRSAEAEVRHILQETVLPKTEQKSPSLSAVFAEFRRRTGGINLGDLRSKELAEPMNFERLTQGKD